MAIPDVISGPRLKVERANRHIGDLRRVTSPLARDFYEITVIHSRGTAIEGYPAGFHLTYRPKKPIPEMLALIIGDAVHNIRSALDHLAASILRAWHPTPPRKPYFPMHPERKSLETAPDLASIEEALPGAKKLLLEDIRPADGPNERFWTSINTLDNTDKHNPILPTVTVVGINNIHARIGRSFFENCSVSGDAAGPIGILRSEAPISINQNFQTSVEVRFGDGSSLKNEPVIPTLLQMSELVSQALSAFEALVRLTKS